MSETIGVESNKELNSKMEEINLKPTVTGEGVTLGDLKIEIETKEEKFKKERVDTGLSVKNDAIVPLGAIEGWTQGMNEISEAALYELGMRGTDTPTDVINVHLHNSYMQGAGLKLSAAFNGWKGADTTNMKLAAADIIKSVSTKYTSFIGNLRGLGSDNPETVKASAAGLNTFMGDYKRMEKLGFAGQTFAQYMQGLLGAAQSAYQKLALLTGGSRVVDQSESLQGYAAALEALNKSEGSRKKEAVEGVQERILELSSKNVASQFTPETS